MRFLTKRFIGDYEPNTGSLYSRLVRLDGEHVAVQIQDTPGCLQVRPRRPPPQSPGNRGGKNLGGSLRSRPRSWRQRAAKREAGFASE